MAMTSEAHSTSTAETLAPTVDLIWNMTLVCPWDCEVCCVDADHVRKVGNVIQIRSRGLSISQALDYRPNCGSIYDQAMVWRQQQGLELDFDSKLRVLDHLDGFRPKLDFSGGDPMAASENLVVMRRASMRFGRERITLTATGAGLARCDPDDIAPLIGELNFTYDSVTAEGNQNRPAGYASGNLRKAAKFAQMGVRTRAECPLSQENVQSPILRQLYVNLHEAGIEKLLLMRLFPVGRGSHRAASIPTSQQYRSAIEVLRKLESEFGFPKVKLQCALRYFDRQDMSENPCDLVRESLGLMADGTLLTSPWAVGPRGDPLDDSFVLGNLAVTPLQDLLASDRASAYRARLDANFGHCKIFAFLNSKREQPMDRLFDRADPLYSDA